jgi:hypothetical protein
MDIPRTYSCRVHSVGTYASALGHPGQRTDNGSFRYPVCNIICRVDMLMGASVSSWVVEGYTLASIKSARLTPPRQLVT